MRYIVMVLFAIFLVSCVKEQNKKADIKSTPTKIVSNKSNAIAIVTERDIENAINATKDKK